MSSWPSQASKVATPTEPSTLLYNAFLTWSILWTTSNCLIAHLIQKHGAKQLSGTNFNADAKIIVAAFTMTDEQAETGALDEFQKRPILIIGLWAKSFEQLQIVPMMVIMPLVFLGGAF